MYEDNVSRILFYSLLYHLILFYSLIYPLILFYSLMHPLILFYSLMYPPPPPHVTLHLGWLLSPRSSTRSQSTSSTTDVAAPVTPRALAKPPAKSSEAASTGETHQLPTVELTSCDSDGCSSDVGAGADRQAAASDQSEPGSPALSSADLSRWVSCVELLVNFCV